MLGIFPKIIKLINGFYQQNIKKRYKIGRTTTHRDVLLHNFPQVNDLY